MSEYAEFDLESAARIARATRRVEGMLPPSEKNPSDPKTIHQLVKITGAGTDGIFPAVIISQTTLDTLETTAGPLVCRVNAINDEQFKIDNIFLARFAGTQDGYGLFAPAFPVKIVEMVKNVECVDGEIDVTYENIVVFDFDAEVP